MALAIETERNPERALSLGLTFVSQDGQVSEAQLRRMAALITAKNRSASHTIRETMATGRTIPNVARMLLPHVKLDHWQVVETWEGEIKESLSVHWEYGEQMVQSTLRLSSVGQTAPKS
jgi:hypothetical protein